MESLIQKIQAKLESCMLNWNPNDLSALAMLTPWKAIFTQNYLENFLKKFIIPKLNYLIAKFEINPKNQKIEAIKILFIWSELIPLNDIADILIQNFFPKFIETFKLWLTQKPKIEEILKWYEGWKKVFSNKNLLENSTEIQKAFKMILTLINNYLSHH